MGIIKIKTNERRRRAASRQGQPIQEYVLWPRQTENQRRQAQNERQGSEGLQLRSGCKRCLSGSQPGTNRETVLRDRDRAEDAPSGTEIQGMGSIRSHWTMVHRLLLAGGLQAEIR